jgi:transposase
MQYFVGLDVSSEPTSICIIDERGVVIKEGQSESDPLSITRSVLHRGRKIEHVRHERVSFPNCCMRS